MSNYLKVIHFVKLYIFFLIFIFTGCAKQSELKVSSPIVTDSTQAASLAFDVQPGGGIASSIWSQQPKVYILDSLGQKITSGPDAWAKITITLSSGSGDILGSVNTYAALGEANFTDLNINLIGVKKITATKADMSSVGGATTLSVESHSFSINQGTGAKLSITGPATLTPNVCTEYLINHTDSGGNIVSATSNVSVDLNGKSNGNFYSDSICSTITTNTTIPVSQSSQSVFYRNSRQESLNFIFTDTQDNLISASLPVSMSNLNISKVYYSSAESQNKCVLYVDGTALCLVFSPFTSNLISNYFKFSKTIVEIANGYQLCFRFSEGSVSCNNGVSDVNLGGPASQIISGSSHVCAIVNVSGSQILKCWGNNNLRQLGDGTTAFRSSPTTINLGLTAGVTIAKLVVSKNTGSYKTYAILSNGQVMVWGGGSTINYNPVRINSVANVVDLDHSNDFAHGTNVVLNDGSVQSFSLNYSSVSNGTINTMQAPLTIAGATDAVEIIKLGESCFRKNTGLVYCWGERATQSGLTVNQTTPTLVTDHPLLNLSSNGTEACGVSSNSNEKLICWANANLRTEPNISYLGNVSERLKFSNTISHITVPNLSCALLNVSLNNNDLAKAATSDFLFYLNDLSGLGSFYSDQNCTTTITNKTIYKGLSSRNLYYSSNYVGTEPKLAFLEATPAVSSGAGSANLTVIIPGQAAILRGYDSISAANICEPSTIGVGDSNYNQTVFSRSGNTTLNFTPLFSGNGKVYSDPDCLNEITSKSVASGLASTTIYLKFFDSCGYFAISVSSPGLQSTSITVGEDCGGGGD